VGNNGAVAQSGRTQVHAALKPSHDIACRNLFRDGVEQYGALQLAVIKSCALQRRLDAGIRKLRPQIRMRQLVPPRLLQNGMIRMQRSTNRQALVSRSRLDVGLLKGRAIEELAIGHAVERASTRHRYIFARNTPVKLIQEVKKYLFEAMLKSES